jgi:hypothetical protein
MEIKGNKKANFLLFTNKDPAKMAMAIWGANPRVLLGMILYKADAKIINTSANMRFLFIFIIQNF